MSTRSYQDVTDTELHFKDESLDGLAEVANVAQFVSFGPDLRERFSRVSRFPRNHSFGSVPNAVGALLASSPERSINVRSFKPDYPKSSEFIYGLTSAEEATAQVLRLASFGLYTMVNETIDVHDGGVSGVTMADIVEFAPDSTPRCVERPDVAALPKELGIKVIETVYGWRPAIHYPPNRRVEFSVHPLRRGYRNEHTIVWEVESIESPDLRSPISWPNMFSRFLGDKTYGLLIAWALGLPVPETIVVSRRVAPFRFGQRTGSGETWIRTCPVEQQPGRFTTQKGWRDPFLIIEAEDREHASIAAVLSQEGVNAKYSGSLIVGGDGQVVIEGVEGQGDEFMKGERPPTMLPETVRMAVLDLYELASKALGPVRLEWVFDADAERAWVVQLHTGQTKSVGRIVYPGERSNNYRFSVTDGIEALYSVLPRVMENGEGVILVGNVGVTSHMGDVLRRARIPSRIEPA